MFLRINAAKHSGLEGKRQKQTDTAKKMESRESKRAMKTHENEIILCTGHIDSILHHGLF